MCKIWGGGSVGSIVGGSGVSCSCYSCFTCMYLECPLGLICPLNLWWYWLPGFSSESGGLFPFFFLVPSCSSSPMGASSALFGVRSVSLCGLINIFLHSCHFCFFPIVFFLGIRACWLRVTGVGYIIINKRVCKVMMHHIPRNGQE